MEKYGKPIDHCCRFGSKWSAWKCEVFQCCRCEKLLDYLNMEFIYLWMIYIYIWFIEDLQIIYRWFCSRLLQLYPCPAWRQVASPWPTSCRRAPGSGAALEVDWLQKIPGKTRSVLPGRISHVEANVPKSWEVKIEIADTRCLEVLLGFIPNFSVCGMYSPRVAFTKEKYPWQTNKITSGPTQPWVGLRCSQQDDQQILWTMLEGGKWWAHARSHFTQGLKPTKCSAKATKSYWKPSIFTVAKRLFCPTTMGRKNIWLVNINC